MDEAMTESGLERLMADVLDGEAGADEVVRLAAALASDPEARARFEQARAGTRALESLPLEEMPADLREEIHRAVSAASPAPGAWRPWRSGLRAAPAFRFAAPFAVGAVAGALVLALAMGFWRAPGRLPLEGSMRPQSGTIVAAADLDGARASLASGGEQAVVLLEVREEGVSRAEVSFDPDRFEASSVSWIRGPRGAARADGSRVALVHRGKGVCEIGLRALAAGPATVHVTWTGASGSRQATLGASP
jgi:hypothetical protein